MKIAKRALVSLLTISAMTGTAFANDGEKIPAGEADAIQAVVGMIRGMVLQGANQEGRAFRDAHRKQHGCVRAEFAVSPDVPANLRHGLFAQSGVYSSVIRYSNGSGQVQDDRSGDGRGMAIKVLGVSGARNLTGADDEKTSQDFLMINHPVFFVRNAEDYVGFQSALANHGTAGALLWLAHPFRVLHEGRIAYAIQSKKMANPLASRYFSMTASKLGPLQMKFQVAPCQGARFLSPSNSENRLRENLNATLASETACFDFAIQPRLMPELMPVEDPTVEWLESDSKPVRVARITIPTQAPDQGEACEALSFNPWNGLAYHRPLGGISRVRKHVYDEVSRLRHEINGQKREEPAR